MAAQLGIGLIEAACTDRKNQAIVLFKNMVMTSMAVIAWCCLEPPSKFPHPHTPHPTLCNLHPTSYIWHPTLCTLHPTPCTLQPTGVPRLIRKCFILGPYSRPMPRPLWWSSEGGAVPYERGTPVHPTSSPSARSKSQNPKPFNLYPTPPPPPQGYLA